MCTWHTRVSKRFRERGIWSGAHHSHRRRRRRWCGGVALWRNKTISLQYWAAMSADILIRLGHLIDSCTTKATLVIEHERVEELKRHVRSSDLACSTACRILFDKLRSAHPQSRLLTLLLMDVLFTRYRLVELVTPCTVRG